MRSTSFIAASLLIFAASPLFAQTPNATPTIIRGTVERLDRARPLSCPQGPWAWYYYDQTPGQFYDCTRADILVVNSRTGQKVSIALAPDFVVAGVVKKHPTDIKRGDYVAATSVAAAEGGLQALEVHIYPEALRGQNEGQKDWDLVPGSIMTSATVAGIANAPQGQLIEVAYQGRESRVAVQADTPVVGFVPGDSRLLKSGATVFIPALQYADGSVTASRVIAEKDGVKPPM
jgi:hypothetical protein